MMGSRIVVFGGAGFLGSHVVDALIEEGHEVTVFDTTDTGKPDNRYRFIKGDITDSNSVAHAVKSQDVVYNFAAIADLNEGLEKPLDTVLVNVYGNAVLLEESVKAGVSKFIYASTVYVKSRDGGFYRCSKAAAEDYVQEYSTRYGLEFCILRYGSLYGPRSGSSNGLFRIVEQALKKKCIKYQGSPDAIREYVHVYDAARASVTALESEFTGKSLVLTGQDSMRVHDLLYMLAEIMGPEYTVEFEEADYVGHYVRTPYALPNNLGQKYQPRMRVDMGQGLMDLVTYVASINRKDTNL
jgi:UDP-glucose 4-epimerase